MLARRVAAVLLTAAALVGPGAGTKAGASPTTSTAGRAAAATTVELPDPGAVDTYRLHMLATSPITLELHDYQHTTDFGLPRPARGTSIAPGGTATFHPRSIMVISSAIFFASVAGPGSSDLASVYFQHKPGQDPTLLVPANDPGLRVVSSTFSDGVVDVYLAG